MLDTRWAVLDTFIIFGLEERRVFGMRRLVSRKWERWFVVN